MHGPGKDCTNRKSGYGIAAQILHRRHRRGAVNQGRCCAADHVERHENQRQADEYSANLSLAAMGRAHEKRDPDKQKQRHEESLFHQQQLRDNRRAKVSAEQDRQTNQRCDISLRDEIRHHDRDGR